MKTVIPKLLKKPCCTQPFTKKKEEKQFIPFFVGFDMANMAGLVDVEPLRASNT
jgi:hypothetical protein